MNWRRFFHREAADAEQQQELDFHIEVTAEDYIAQGMDPATARAAARRKLGNPAQIREEVYRMNTINAVEDIVRDARHALRLFRTHPGFVCTVVLSLALGIGANTAIFSVIDSILIQPLPYPQAANLVGVYNRLTINGQAYPDAALSPGMYAACRDACRAFDQFGVWTAGAATVTGAAPAEEIKTITATRGALAALGVNASLGRWFSSEEDTPAGARTAILSHGYWQSKFGGGRSILGRTIIIDFLPHEIVGVMPPAFRFVGHAPDVILPQRLTSLRPDEFSYNGLARLKTGVKPQQANQDIARVWEAWAEKERLTRILHELAVTPNTRPLKDDVVGDIASAIGVVMGALALLLLLVCANVANLFIVRARSRRQEFAIRQALGGARGRLVREQLVESATLGLAGGALALALAHAAIRALAAAAPAGLPRIDELAVGPAATAFTLLCTLTASLLFGLAAALRTRVSQPLQNTRGASPGRQHLRTQRLLVVGQVAMALVLLIGSGLMVRTLLAIAAVDPGFTNPSHVQTIRISIPPPLAREPERVVQMQKQMVDNLAAIPGVSAAAFASALPLDDNRNGILIAVEGKTDPDRMPPNRRYRHASPGLFAAQGTKILAGRDFTWDDVFHRRRLAIVSENMAHESWGSPREAVGKRIRIGRDGPWTEVAGVVENIHADGMHLPAPPTVYARAGIESNSVRRAVTLAIRSPRAGTQAFLAEAAAAIQAVNPNIPLAQVRTLEDARLRSMARTSFTVALLAIAAAMALAVAIIGVYGILAYAVAERRHEIGIRLALGAAPRAVRTLFVRQALGLASLGAIAGLIAAAILTRWIASLLFGVQPLDPLTYILSVAALAAAAVLASYLPARRAAAIDPMETLRDN